MRRAAWGDVGRCGNFEAPKEKSRRERGAPLGTKSNFRLVLGTSMFWCSFCPAGMVVLKPVSQ